MAHHIAKNDSPSIQLKESKIFFGMQSAEGEYMFDGSDASRNSSGCKSRRQNFPVAVVAWIECQDSDVLILGRSKKFFACSFEKLGELVGCSTSEPHTFNSL